ncbi:MAG: hypothetical protein AUK03_17620 [Anaerolineae bacterium CG2_30_64_16]|nr:MAG: hypothetical protein AUK03_17620 [Anaerolineae bacterium CG2_30_64_16]
MLEIALDVWAETGRHSRWPVQGASMWPLLQPGDVVEVAHGKQGACPEAPPEFSEGCSEGIRVGDILVYRAGERVVVHRLLRRAGDSWLLGSDHLPAADALIPSEAIIGRVIAVQAPTGRLDLTSRPARWLGRLIAACHPWRSRQGLRRVVRLLAHLQRSIHAVGGGTATEKRTQRRKERKE